MATHFEISEPLERPKTTLAHFDITQHIKPNHLLRWEYLRTNVPVSKLNELSRFVLKAVVDGIYGLSPAERRELEKFAEYVASLQHFKLIRLGRNNFFVNLVRKKRQQLFHGCQL